jgi:hypothetical protein
MSSQPPTSTGGVREVASAASTEPRLCLTCGEPLSLARLAAIPYAPNCTVCTAAAGDVPKIKRYDETVGLSEDAEIVSTYYKEGKTNQYLRLMIERDMNTALGQLVPGGNLEN